MIARISVTGTITAIDKETFFYFLEVLPPKFQHGSLFGREWPKLLRAYAVEAYRQGPQPVEESKLGERVKDVLDGAARAEGMLRGNAGVGQLFEFAVGNRQGAALLFEGRVVHSAIL